MDNIRNKYRILLITVLLLMSVLISAIYIVSLEKVESTYRDYAKESIIDLKKTFLKDTVNNVIIEIERNQEEQTEYYQFLSETIGRTLDNYFTNSNNTFLSFCIDYFEGEQNKAGFSLLIIHKDTGHIIYNSIPSSIFVDIKEVESKFDVYSRKNYGDYDLIWGVDKGVIDDKVKKQIHAEIHSYKFSNDAYIWVNEVINYDGGDNYAIRRIHPNMKDTEGMYLSTQMTDIKGNFPYLTELEGVKKDGELFFNYYFKKNNSDIISEKVTYAKLYEEYNWIIAMGVYLDDVQAYVNQTTSQSMQNTKKLMVMIAVLIVVIIVAVFILVTFLEKWYHMKSNRLISEEIYRDPLTKAYNRRGAHKFLDKAWEDFKYMGINSSIIMIDIDNFKRVNDICGHHKGDSVLINVSETISKYIRSTDILCRWGGEEFLLICKGLKEDDVVPFTEKLLHSVSRIEYQCSETKANTTISIGVSFFATSDSDFNEAIERADIALYKSKDKGKNQANIEFRYAKEQ